MTTPSLTPPSTPTWLLYVRLYRPKTLLLGLALGFYSAVCVPIVLLEGAENTLLWVGGALVTWIAVSLQGAANALNAWFDFKTGVDGPKRLGPKRLEGGVSPSMAKKAAYGGFVSALLAGAALAWMIEMVSAAGYVFHHQTTVWDLITLFGLIAFAPVAAWLYSGGPLPVSSTPFGELFAFFFFGPYAVLIGSSLTLWLVGYPPAGVLMGAALLFSLAPGLLAAMVMLVNNLRDQHTDYQSGRRTLAAWLGRRWGEKSPLLLYVLLLVLACLAALGSLSWFHTPTAFKMALGLWLGGLGYGLMLTLLMRRAPLSDFNHFLGQTLLLCSLMIVGLGLILGFTPIVPKL